MTGPDIDIPPTIDGLEHALHWAQHFASELGGTVTIGSTKLDDGRPAFEVIYRAATYFEVLAEDTESLAALTWAIRKLWDRRDDARKKHGPRSAA